MKRNSRALIKAAREGHSTVVEQLVAAGTKLDGRGYHGLTALMYAARGGHSAIVAQLVAAGAEVNVRD